VDILITGLLGGLALTLVILWLAWLPNKTPKGMRAVKCRRCNTIQNVPRGAAGTTECYLCKSPL
jgi:hypothetical protein